MNTLMIQVVDEIAEAIAGAINNIETAAAKYAKALDAYGAVVTDKLQERAPEIPRSFWNRLEMIGRNQMDRRLLYGETPAAKRLRKIPLSDQRAAMDHGVEVLLDDGDTLRVQIDNLTGYQARQVFAPDHIRDLPEQRAWIESGPMERRRPRITGDHIRVTKDYVEIIQPCRMTRRQVARILEEMA